MATTLVRTLSEPPAVLGAHGGFRVVDDAERYRARAAQYRLTRSEVPERVSPDAVGADEDLGRASRSRCFAGPCRRAPSCSWRRRRPRSPARACRVSSNRMATSRRPEAAERRDPSRISSRVSHPPPSPAVVERGSNRASATVSFANHARQMASRAASTWERVASSIVVEFVDAAALGVGLLLRSSGSRRHRATARRSARACPCDSLERPRPIIAAVSRRKRSRGQNVGAGGDTVQRRFRERRVRHPSGRLCAVVPFAAGDTPDA